MSADDLAPRKARIYADNYPMCILLYGYTRTRFPLCIHKYQWFCRRHIFKVSLIERCPILIQISLNFLPEVLNGNYSFSVHVMAWCRQATSHWPNQCCPTFISPYIVAPLGNDELNSAIRITDDEFGYPGACTRITHRHVKDLTRL